MPFFYLKAGKFMELKGKVIDFLGDSITEGTGTTCAENRYDRILLRECELAAANNYGIGGSRFAYQKKPSEKPRYDLYFCGRVYNLDPNADIVVVYGGVNDYLHGSAPMGTPDDTTPDTFYGACYFLMNYLKENFKDKPIVFMSPARMFYYNTSGENLSPRPEKSPDALPLTGYVNIIKEQAAKFQIPVLDLYENLGIDPAKEDDRKEYTIDGLHFNDKGHYKLAQMLKSFLEAL